MIRQNVAQAVKTAKRWCARLYGVEMPFRKCSFGWLCQRLAGETPAAPSDEGELRSLDSPFGYAQGRLTAAVPT
jgi:hypothetical protein